MLILHKRLPYRWYPDFRPGSGNQDTASIERSFSLFFRSFGFARTNQTQLEIIMFLTLSVLTHPNTDFSHK